MKETDKNLIKRIIEISFKHKLGHLGSSFSVLDILDCIYEIRKANEPVVLSNGHAGMALYVILEKYGLANAEELYLKHGVHPNRDPANGIYVSTGSLGQGLPIAVGMALSDKKEKVYCVVSDGECAEGSIAESIRVVSAQKLTNLKIIINANGYGGYNEINIKTLPPLFKGFGCEVIEVDGHNKEELHKALRTEDSSKTYIYIAKTKSERFSFLRGQDAHYKVMEKSDYLTALGELKL